MADDAFGTWLRENRIALGFSQAQLAEFIGTYQVKISQWETGKGRPEKEILDQLEELFEGKAPGSVPKHQDAQSLRKPPTIDELRAKVKPEFKNRAKGTVDTADYRHDSEKRTNIPLAKIAAEGPVPKVSKARYAYNPHLPPVLRFDPTGDADRIQELISEAGQRLLTVSEQRLLLEAVSHYNPWLEWTERREQHERGFFEVDPVALHIHERVSSQAIVRTAMREEAQRSLFADPQQPYQEAVQFYRHDVDWANRLILGDSLQVMSSLARREGLGGKVQMIYIDPPYGVKFASNFQPEVTRRQVSEKEQDLTREPETVRAYRDTWKLGTHSYLSYLRSRLLAARELLSATGALFLQISDENVHRVRLILDDVFSPENFVGQIAFRKTGAASSKTLASTFDYILFYARDRSELKYRRLYLRKVPGGEGARQYTWAESLSKGAYRTLSREELENSALIPQSWHVFRPGPLSSPGYQATSSGPIELFGRIFSPGSNRHWSVGEAGTRKLAECGRTMVIGNTLCSKLYLDDYPISPEKNYWENTVGTGFGEKQRYVVQTSTNAIERCLLMATDPGELVLDPTCGSGTTPYVAEKWGRRWIGIDTSRVALLISRQRVLTAKYEFFRTVDGDGEGHNPGNGFVVQTVPHVSLSAVSRSADLEPILDYHRSILQVRLAACNDALLAGVSGALRTRLAAKLREKERTEGKRSVTDAHRRRWLLPPDNRDRSPKARKIATVDLDAPSWYEWEVPFDTDPDWPQALQEAVTAYQKAWRVKMNEVNDCIAANAEVEALVDQPEVVKGVLRVSGPFTVEGVRPGELNLGEEGLFAGPPNKVEETEGETAEAAQADLQNQSAYLGRMVQLLRADGVTFPDNQQRNFARIEPLFESSDSGGSVIHAEGLWEGEDGTEPNHVGIGFGPQYGPVTAEHVEELIRASRRYDELVIGGFSFDAAASAVVQESAHPRLRIHQAYIRPDVNPGMDGLLKDTPNSQIFTVFGQPEIRVERNGNEWTCELLGVDIYDPLTSTVRSTGASKVAAWFVDQDYDGRCFCITQAFFPNENAWEKIAKTLGSSADPEAFAAFEGTVSLPFRSGRHRRIAVKVIDPRGNEVMTIQRLED